MNGAVAAKMPRSAIVELMINSRDDFSSVPERVEGWLTREKAEHE